MRIDKVSLTNFRQYYGTVDIDLATTEDKNIILIGGKNGYGKTNFLVALVLCLYGEEMVKIDENFKREVIREGNYSKFLKSCLNWDASRKNKASFSIQITFSELELPLSISSLGKDAICRITRTFDINSINDDVQVDVSGSKKNLFQTNEDKINFINDYVIPLEAAKFVFFDAEKIASWAELSTKEEGSVLNDALAKLLGLDVYEGLIDDLVYYADNLKRESANTNLKQQIIASEKGIELNLQKIEDIQNELLSCDNEVNRLKAEIVNYERFFYAQGRSTITAENLDDVYAKRQLLITKEKDVEARFSILTEMLPFMIALGKLEEVILHLEKQDQLTIEKEQRMELEKNIAVIVEQLFNNPPFPEDGDISFSKKIFYAHKAEEIISRVFDQETNEQDIDFEHDISKSDRVFIRDMLNFVSSQSKEIFEETIDSYRRVKEEVAEINNLIRRIEADLQDEEAIEYSNKKLEAERKVEKLSEHKGGLLSRKDHIKKENDKIHMSLQVLFRKVEVSEQKQKKLDYANLYIKALSDFVVNEKNSRCELLGDLIYQEMQILMHKLTDESQRFIATVKANLLPGNDGLQISLYGDEGSIRAKESLSQGEKQIYISSLIKALLALSTRKFPIFIDTPLGRLDDDHIRKVLLNYYPNLADQVVLLATSNEIPPSRYKLIEDNISKAYLLENYRNKTSFKNGYYKSYEN